MKSILKSVIDAGGYRLVDIQHKIKKMYAIGDLTETEMDELLALASSGASANAERPDVMHMILSIAEKIADLEGRMNLLDGGGSETEPDNGEHFEYPAWEPWDGISNLYQYGAIVSHNGKNWISTFTGQNVWEPGVVNDNFWTEHTVL